MISLSECLTPECVALRDAAIEFMRGNKKQIAKGLTDRERYPRDRNPVAVFMAGSPGAGKTETARALLEEYPGVLHIDADEYRKLVPGYNGQNSWLVQPAVSILVEKVIDLAIDNAQNFILDGTLTNYAKAESNIARCLGRGRAVQIIFVHQDPKQAWFFVQAREAQEGRKIPKEVFVNQYFESQRVVTDLQNKFGARIGVDVLLKNLDGTVRQQYQNVDTIESCVPRRWSKDDVLRIVT